jgi:MFS family permease
VKHVLGALAALLVSAFVLTIGHGLALLVMPLRAELIGFTPLEISLTGSAYYAGFVAGCFASPAVIARVGHVRVYAVFGATLIVTFLAVHMATSVWAWLLLRAAMGVLMAGQFMVIETWLNERATASTRGRVLAIYVLVTLGANTLGQLLVNVAPVQAETLFLLSAMLVALSIVPVGLSAAELPAPVTSARVALGLLWRLAPVGFVGATASGFITGASGALNAVFVRGVGFDVFAVSVYTSAVIAGGAMFQYPVGRIADRIDRRTALMGLFTGVAGVSALAILVTLSQPALLPVVGFCWGGMAHCIYASALAHANDRASPGEIVGIGGAILVMWGVGAVIGPLGASLCMDLFGSVGFFVWMIGAGLTALVLTLLVRMGGLRPAA